MCYDRKQSFVTLDLDDAHDDGTLALKYETISEETLSMLLCLLVGFICLTYLSLSLVDHHLICIDSWTLMSLGNLELCGCIHWKPSRDKTRPLGVT